jgi:hypothetical protein
MTTIRVAVPLGREPGGLVVSLTRCAHRIGFAGAQRDPSGFARTWRRPQTVPGWERQRR